MELLVGILAFVLGFCVGVLSQLQKVRELRSRLYAHRLMTKNLLAARRLLEDGDRDNGA